MTKLDRHINIRPEDFGEEGNTIQDGDLTDVDIWGYRQSQWRTTMTWCGYILTVGLLRLVFHWAPNLQLYCTHKRCSLSNAEMILAKDQYKQLSVHSVSLTTRDGTLVSLVSSERIFSDCFQAPSVHAGAGDAERVPLVHASSDSNLIRYFFYKKLKFIWNSNGNNFVRLKGLESGPCSQFHEALPLDAVNSGRQRVIYGDNSIVVAITPLYRLLINEGLNPFYVFQVASFILWYLDDYYQYATCILIISILSLSVQVYEMRKNEKALRDTVCDSGTGLVSRGGNEFTEVDTVEFVPGDILEIPRNGCMMFCDAVLISGNCIVNESTLTGESVPVTKTPIVGGGGKSAGDDTDEEFNIKNHSRHILFCGTRVIQTRYYEGEHVRALVVRTGFSTAKGEMVRSILFPKPMDFKFNRDAMRFILVLGLFALCGLGYTAYIMVIRGYAVGHIIIRALDLVTIVVPPALPVAMTVGIVFAQRRLKKKRIFCISPNVINVGGVINVVCFDKTGTLTEDGLDLWGVVANCSGRFEEPEPDPHRLSRGPLLEAMASCHTLTRIDGEMAGDPLDLKMFQAIRWEFTEEVSEDYRKFEMMVPTIVRPVEPDLLRRNIELDSLGTLPYEVGIIRQFPFSSSLQRMSVIARVLSADHFSVYLKGSPEMVETLCLPETMPHDFHSTLLTYTRHGYRVIALAWRPLKASLVKVQRLTRDQVEGNLRFLGLLVMENRLKPETTPVIETLKSAHIRPLMVTGDNMLTALSVARDCNLLDRQDAVILVTARAPQESEGETREAQVEFHYAEDLQRPVTELETSRRPRHAPHRSEGNGSIHSASESQANGSSTRDSYISIHMSEHSNFHLAMSGKTWGVIRDNCPELIPKLVVKGTVFARFSPDQKTQLVEALQSVGYLVGMCGDGANDCGALKAAHTGISLSEAEASVASPFTSQDQNISCFPELVRQGRCALATSFGTFKFMAGYSMTQFISVLILYWIGNNLTDLQFLYIDLFMITTLGITFGYTKAFPGLSKEPPSMRLVSTVTILSLVAQIVICTGFQSFAYVYITKQPWFVPYHMDVDSTDYECMENTAVFIASSFQYLILAIVFSKGAPYRKSIFSNYFFMVNCLILTAITAYIVIYPFDWLKRQIGMVDYPTLAPRLVLLGCVFANFLLSNLVELIIDDIRFRKSIRRFKKLICPSCFRHKEYERLTEEIQCSTPAWPPLTKSSSVQDMPADLFHEAPVRSSSRQRVRQVTSSSTEASGDEVGVSSPSNQAAANIVFSLDDQSTRV